MRQRKLWLNITSISVSICFVLLGIVEPFLIPLTDFSLELLYTWLNFGCSSVVAVVNLFSMWHILRSWKVLERIGIFVNK